MRNDSTVRFVALGAGLLFLGAMLLPFARVPMFGAQSFVELAGTVRVAIVALLGVAALACAVLKRDRAIPVLGLAALAMVAYTAWDLRRVPSGDDLGSAVGRFMRGLAGAIEFAWGLPALCAAALALVVAGLLLQRRPGAA